MNITEVKSSSVKQLSDDELAHILWNFHHLDTDLHNEQGNITADCLIVCGSNEERIAERAAELYRDGRINKIVFSGSTIHERFEEKYGEGLTEAEVFTKIAMERGVPQEAIFIENKATNTSQNMALSARLLEEHNIPYDNIIIVSAAQHEQRALATAMQQIPGRKIRVTSPVESFENFISDLKYHTGRIRALIGHTLRFYIYGRKGDLISQDIPANVLAAYRELIHRGYTPLAVESLKEDMEKLEINIELQDTNHNFREAELSLHNSDQTNPSPKHGITAR